MNNSYNLLMTRRINMIKQDLNEEDIREFNLSIGTIKRKKKRKLNTKELDELTYLINDLQKIPKDERFQDYILRHLKVFLIYGNVKQIDKNTIVLDLTNGEETFILKIAINKNCVTSTLKKDNYIEEAFWKALNNDYYTNYQRKETTINDGIYTINTTKELHGFHENKEIVTRLISEHDKYIKDNMTKRISRKGFGGDNYKDTTTYYRQEGFLIRKHSKRYENEKIGKLLNYKEYQISEDYNIDNKYLKQVGHYKDFDRKLYNPFLRGKCKIKTIYEQS